MSGLDSLHITIPDSDMNGPCSPLSHSKHSSVSSIRSGFSSPSPYEIPCDFLSFNEDSPPQTQSKSSKKGISTFVNKLYAMVEDGTHQDLIYWNSNGTSFFVCNAKQFAQVVLPEYFKHSNFSSFVRLLNMYGFHKINKSPRGQRGRNKNEIWEFSHPRFQHSRSDLLKEIKRKAMDSELLRREAGDMHASFATLQMSQADLLQQFHILQDNFSSLLQGFEKSKKIQIQQQTIIRQLAERQGLSQNDILQEFKFEDQHTSSPVDSLSNINTPITTTASPLTVFVTAPNSEPQNSYNTLQTVNDNNKAWSHNEMQQSLQSNPDITMSMYDTSANSPSPASMSPNMFNQAVGTPLPPSPMINSPVMNDSFNNSQQKNHYTTNNFKLKYENVNTLGLEFSA